jgi:hypothetical protein
MAQRLLLDKMVEFVFIERMSDFGNLYPGEFIVMPLGIQDARETHRLQVIDENLIDAELIVELTAEEGLLLIQDMLGTLELMKD